jgi:hypothetical protein
MAPTTATGFVGGTSRFAQTPSIGPLVRTELPAGEGEVAT